MTFPGKAPLVSIILPTYNQSDHLSDAIRSILCQTFTDFELIVVDDGSTDATESILECFSDLKISVIKHPKNSGVAKAYNSGLAVSRGQFIGFIGSEDIWLPEKLEEEISCFLHLPPEFGVVYADMWEIDTAGNRKYWSSPEISGPELFSSSNSDYQVACLGNGPSLIRRSFLDMAGGFDERFGALVDLDLLIRLTRVCHFHHIRKPLYIYKSHRGTSSNLTETSRSRLLLLTKYPESVMNHGFFQRQCEIIGHNLLLLGEENRRLRKEIADATERYGTSRSELLSLEIENRTFHKEIEILEGQLKEGENSLTGNVIRFVDKTFINRICPPGSERNRIYHKRLDAVRKRLNPLIMRQSSDQFKKGNF